VSRTLALVPHGLQTARERIRWQDYALARTLLRRLLRIDRRNAEAWYLLGLAWENDPFGSDEVAHRCYHRAVRRDRRNALMLAVLGRNAMRLCKDRLGHKALHAAATRAANDVNVVTVVVEAYLESQDIEAAWRAVNRARFFRVAQQVRPPVPERFGASRVLPLLRVVDGRTRLPRLRRDPASLRLPHFG
jgi:tetratricopeptide (TPR) repeat protein